MPDKTWKKAERRAAKVLGGRRVPFSGGLAPESTLPKSDIMNVEGFLFIEVKHRKNWQVQKWIREMELKARLGQPWLLIVGTPGVHGQYAVLPLKRLQAMRASVAELPAPQNGAPAPGSNPLGSAPAQEGTE